MSWRSVLGGRLPLVLVLPVVGVCASEAPAAPEHAKLAPVPFEQVELTDRFWAPRLQTLRDVTVAHEIRMCEETGRLRNFRAAAGIEQAPFEGIYFNDSDVYKVLEGASYLYALEKDPAKRAALAAQMDPIIDWIAQAQQDDGYIYTFYQLGDPSLRWSDLPAMHELYCMGHLIEGAVAHYRATGSRKFLDVAIGVADLIDSVFGPGKNEGVCGHEEIELALVKLADATGEQRYFRLAQSFVDHRGYSGAEYDQDHMPVRQQRSVVGHAVRAMYLFCAASDIALRTGDEGLRESANAIWDDLTLRKMYITGGIGPSGSNEGFTTEYDLPNDTAYAETCAAIGMALYGNRMAHLEANTRFVDEVERAMMNGALSGISLSGDGFFYVNPLAARSRIDRVPWFGCACCPPNILRVIPQVPEMLYATSDEGLWLNLYAASRAHCEVAGTKVDLEVKSDYPWDGRIELTLACETPKSFDLKLRKPGWCRGYTLTVDGAPVEAPVGADGYIALRQEWSKQTVVLELAMPVERVRANPLVKADIGRVALQRGPLVYSLEGVDNQDSLFDLYLPRESELTASYDPELLGGVVKLTGPARRGEEVWDGELYRSADAGSEATIEAIPYYAWANRGSREMTVWLPEAASLTEPKLAPSLADEAVAGASYVHQRLGALSDRKMPSSSSEISFDWWPHQGTEEWVSYTFGRTVEVGAVEVWWFDDSGHGGCKVPASWVVEWQDGEVWREVSAGSAYGRDVDRFNRVSFEPVRTRQLRLRVQLQEGFSGGICEWRVLAPGR